MPAAADVCRRRAFPWRQHGTGGAAEFDFLNNVMLEPDKEEHDELLQAGIDPEELEYMSADERREVLEDAGLDPDDYDF